MIAAVKLHNIFNNLKSIIIKSFFSYCCNMPIIGHSTNTLQLPHYYNAVTSVSSIGLQGSFHRVSAVFAGSFCKFITIYINFMCYCSLYYIRQFIAQCRHRSSIYSPGTWTMIRGIASLKCVRETWNVDSWPSVTRQVSSIIRPCFARIMRQGNIARVCAMNGQDQTCFSETESPANILFLLR